MVYVFLYPSQLYQLTFQSPNAKKKHFTCAHYTVPELIVPKLVKNRLMFGLHFCRGSIYKQADVDRMGGTILALQYTATLYNTRTVL